MSKLAWHSTLLISGKVISGLASIAGGIILARWLTVQEYGTYSQFILIASTLVLFSNLSLPRALYYFVPRAQSGSEKKRVITQIIFIVILSSLVFSFLLFPLSPFLSKYMQNELISSSVIVIAVYLFILSISTLFEPLMVSLGHVKIVAFVESLTGAGLFLAILIPLLLGTDYRSILFYMSAVLSIKLVLLFWGALGVKGTFHIKQLFLGVSEKVKYSLPLTIGSMIGVINRRIDQLIISSMYLPGEYAIYARGAFELPLIAIIPMTISNLMLPVFSKDFAVGKTEKIAEQFSDKARIVSLLFFPLTILMLILAEAFIVFMFSEKYLESVSIFRVYLLILPFRITISGIILRASGQTHRFIVGDLACLISNIVMSFVFIKMFGMIGAAWGTVFSILLYTIYIFRVNSQVLDTSTSKVLPWYDLIVIMGVSILSGITVLPLFLYIKTYILQLIFTPILFVFVYLIYGYFLKIFTQKDINYFLGVFHRRKIN